MASGAFAAAALALALAGPVRAEPRALALPKALEAARDALAEEDFERLARLEAYLAPGFESVLKRDKTDLAPLFKEAVESRSKAQAAALLRRVALRDLFAQLELPADAEPEALKSRVQLAYLDYYYVLSESVADEDLEADGFIKNSFHRAFQAPRSEWPARIVRKLKELFPREAPPGTPP